MGQATTTELHRGAKENAAASACPFGRGDLLLALVLAALAGVVRFWALDRYPPGLHYDEAYNALDALKILQGEHHIFFTGNFGREPLFMYAIAFAFSFLEPGPVAMRALAAAAGTLAVPITFGIGRLVEPRSRLPGLLAALVQVSLPWDLHMSRYGLRMELLPFLGGAAVLCVLIAWRSRRWPWFVASGAFLGLSLYGYMAARLLPFVFLAWGLLALWRAPVPGRRQLLFSFLLTAVFALAVFAPLGFYFLRYPEAFTLRARQVALRGGGGGVAEQVAGNTWLWLKGMVVSGDTNPRNNLPGAPALTPWLVLPWLVGLGFCLRHWRRPEMALAPLWFAVMLLASILSEYAPSFQRAIGAVPPLCLTVGLGLWQVKRWLDGLSHRPALGLALAAVLVFGSSLQSLQQYFVRWGRSNDLYYAFDEGIYQIGEYMRDRTAAGARVYLSPVRSDHTTLHFLMRDVSAPVTFDGRRLFVLPPSTATAVEYIVLTQEDGVGLTAAEAWFPGHHVARTFVDRAGQTYAVALSVDTATRRALSPALVTDAQWEGGISLVGLDAAPAWQQGETVPVVFYWQTSGTLPEDYTSFIHLIGPTNAATGTAFWAGADGMPGSGTYPTTRWAVGETVVEPRDLALPDGLVDGDYYLEIGWYLLATGQRLDVVQPYAETSLLVGPYHIENGFVVSGPDPQSPVTNDGPR